MANYSTLKAAVADVVKTNGTQAITGSNLQTVLLSIINSVGGGGYIFEGVATPSTDAGTPDQNVFYVGGAGTYANFGTSVTVPVGSICVFKYNGSWTSEIISNGLLDEVNVLQKTILGGSYDYTWKNTASSKWYDNSGKLGIITPSSFHRMDKIPVVAGQIYSYSITNSGLTGPYLLIVDGEENVLSSTYATFGNNLSVPTSGKYLCFNSLNPFSCTLQNMSSGKQDKLTFDNTPTSDSSNPVTSDGIFDALENKAIEIHDGVDYSSTSIISNSRWINDNGVISTESTNYSRRVAEIPVNGGDYIIYRTAIENTYITTILPAFICDADGNILKEIEVAKCWGLLLMPPSASTIRFNYSAANNVPFMCKNLGSLPQNISPFLSYGIDDGATIPLTQSMFRVGSINGTYGNSTATSAQICTIDAIRIQGGTDIRYKTINSYRVGFAFYRQDGSFIMVANFFSGSGTIASPFDAWYMIIYIANPSGGSGTPTLALAGLEVYVTRTPCAARSIRYNVPLFAPSYQLPANGNDDADFDAETLTPAQLDAAFSSLMDKLPASKGNTWAFPKDITIFETPARDATNTYDINAYIITKRNRYGWVAQLPLYAWENGGTIVYTDSVSPRIGDAIYSDTSRNTNGTSVTAYNVTSGITSSASVVYAPSQTNNFAGDIVYSTDCPRIDGASKPTSIVDAKNVHLGRGTMTNGVLDFNTKTYTRMQSFDFHTDNKGTFVIWGNEHGPQSDPAECAITLFRLVKDLVSGCRNHPFLSYLKQYLKIVIIPCANPYGLAHHTRNNGNNVNINRNYSTPAWSSVADTDKGAYAGDQNETQYIMNLCKLFADVAIDIHCLSYITSANQGMVEIAGVTSSLADRQAVIDTMDSMGYVAGDYGKGNYNTSSQGDAWINYQGISGGLIEMNAGPYASSYDGNQHSGEIMCVDYTFLLNTMIMWYKAIDNTFDVGGISY